MLSRLVPHKQIEHALVVVQRLAAELPDLHLDVVGEGWWHDRLVAAAADLGVSDRVASTATSTTPGATSWSARRG